MHQLIQIMFQFFVRLQSERLICITSNRKVATNSCQLLMRQFEVVKFRTQCSLNKICPTTFCTDPRYGLKDHQQFRRLPMLQHADNAIGKCVGFPENFIDFGALRTALCACVCAMAIKPLRSLIKNKIEIFPFVVFLFHFSTYNKRMQFQECKQFLYSSELMQTKLRQTGHTQFQSFDRSTNCPENMHIYHMTMAYN